MYGDDYNSVSKPVVMRIISHNFLIMSLSVGQNIILEPNLLKAVLEGLKQGALHEDLFYSVHPGIRENYKTHRSRWTEYSLAYTQSSTSEIFMRQSLGTQQ